MCNCIILIYPKTLLISGGDIFHSPLADSLPTLPFEVLKTLYDATPLSTDDGRVLRRLSINLGIVHMLLACLGIFTHQSSNSERDSHNNKNKEDRSQLYWAKGTVQTFAFNCKIKMEFFRNWLWYRFNTTKLEC